MKIDVDELMREAEMYCEGIRKVNDQYMETLREQSFPNPSPFGVEWETQRVTEAFALIARWSQGRKATLYELQIFKMEALRIILVMLEAM